ncbi:4-alpha-glucanotransferase [bacterium]|nr:4-alpha-glucanotransferase [bacterium]
MRILGIKDYSYKNPAFERRLRKDEEQDYKNTIHAAQKQLGLHNVAMIVHGSAFPSDGFDSGIGSPYGMPSKKFLKFLDLHGFNNVQLGPPGEISKSKISPYESGVFAKNKLFIDLEALTGDEYANILSDETYSRVLEKNPADGKTNYNYSKFYDAFDNYDIALSEAYENFKKKVDAGDLNARKMAADFNLFRMKNSEWLVKDGIFKVLTKMYGTDDFEKWENPLDKDLPKLVAKGNKEALERFDRILTRSDDEILKNSFIQFIADKQIKEHANFRKEIGFSYINDLLVGFSKSDVWSNPDAFLKDWRMGSKYGGPDGGPQLWNIAVLDPDKLYDKNGKLGVSGELLREKINSSLDGFDNLRVDHAFGLVDPYIYNVNDPKIGGNISKLGHLGIDNDKKFREILERIVFPAFKEHGVKLNDAVWEDIGAATDVFDYMYHYKYRLPGLTQIQWARAEHCPQSNWTLVGSHDSVPASQMNMEVWNKDYLAGYLNADPLREAEREKFKSKLDNKSNMLNAKFAELFRATKNIQISFADFFGIDKVYNYGGQNHIKSNWKLRLNNDYEDTYYKSLENINSNTMCMPEVLKTAVQGKIDMTVAKWNDRDIKIEKLEGKNPHHAAQIREALYEKYQPLLNKLDKYSKILREKEN